MAEKDKPVPLPEDKKEEPKKEPPTPVQQMVSLVAAAPLLTCEIVRSFSFKLNAGNYESRDFFCSQKVSCPLDKAEEISSLVYQFCRTQVLRDVAEFKAANKMK